MCRDFDGALHNDYNDVLYVASAGNAGNDGKAKYPNALYNTIGNPAGCKNTFAVGASQSYGKDIYSGVDLGVDYLADFSSRGPTADGKLKICCVMN